MQSGKSTIVVDLRCLQDPDYARRGVGRHALALLRHAPAHLRLVGLTDPGLPTLLPEAHDSSGGGQYERLRREFCRDAAFGPGLLRHDVTHDA